MSLSVEMQLQLLEGHLDYLEGVRLELWELDHEDDLQYAIKVTKQDIKDLK
jgi:hypothetical protein